MKSSSDYSFKRLGNLLNRSPIQMIILLFTAKSIYELKTQKTGNHRNTFDGTVIKICVTFTFCQSAQEWGHNATFANEYLKNAYS